MRQLGDCAASSLGIQITLDPIGSGFLNLPGNLSRQFYELLNVLRMFNSTRCSCA